MNVNIFHSAEVRWIIAGKAPKAAKDWFANDEACVLESGRGRTDYYWNVPNSEFVGIKLRQYPQAGRAPNLEFKPLVQPLRDVSLPAGITGQADVWDKWSTENQAARGMLALLAQRKDFWLAVHKVRWLKKYSADQGKTMKVGASDRPTDGCNVEYTELQVGAVDEIREDDPSCGTLFWTVGFEAFDDKTRVAQILQEALASELLATDCPSELKRFLTTENSTNYAEWVVRNAGLAR